ncbi:MAG: ABC transporter substrate-binding protein [Desulfomonilia bacterium]|jgi:ABC-type uncharacterized transport system substrate-binding protein
MITSLKSVVCIICITLAAPGVFAQDLKGKKMLFIDSYHEGYAWSDGLTSGIQEVIEGKGIDFRIFRMDTKRNASTEFKENKALEAKALIEEFKPDVVIAADDNASLYVVAPYYKNSSIPIVFCGVNWDCSNYGYPYENTTGMIEMSGIRQILEKLQTITPGRRLGYLSASEYTDQKEVEVYKKIFGLDIQTFFVQDFAEWKDKFIELQSKLDMFIVGNNAGIKGWDHAQAEDFVLKNKKIPTGALYEWVAPYALLSASNVPEEQGRWSAYAALKILRGTPPSSIEMATNKEIKLIVNRKVEKASGITIPSDIIAAADVIIE